MLLRLFKFKITLLLAKHLLNMNHALRLSYAGFPEIVRLYICLGQDYDRMKVLDIQADEAERMHHKKKRVNPLTGFSSE